METKESIAKRFVAAHKSEYAAMFFRLSSTSEEFWNNVFLWMLVGKFGEVILDHNQEDHTTSFTIPIPAKRHRRDEDTLFFWRSGNVGAEK